MAGASRRKSDRGCSSAIYDAYFWAQSFQWFPGIDDVRQMVIVELLFNMGLTKFKGFHRFIGACAARDWTEAAAELADSKWQKQVDPVLGDGKGRADTLIRQIKTGEWQPPAPPQS